MIQRLIPRIVALVLCLMAFNVRAESTASVEYRVKAVVLFNFAKYVQWPAGTFSSPQQAIQACVVGKNPFGDVFESAEAPKEAQDRPFKVKILSSDDLKKEIGSCQMLFWQEDNANAVKSAMAEIKDKHILTVSDQKSDDALISFVFENQKVRFRIRRKVAEGLGFELSSQLLKLAIIDDD